MTGAGEFTWSTYDTLLRLDFVSFARRSFAELSPRGGFLMTWHIETVGAKLAALRRGELRRVIMMPGLPVRLRAPRGVGRVQLFSGRRCSVPADGIVEMTEKDAAPLLRAGWVRVDADDP
jgi:hypothetical protein